MRIAAAYIRVSTEEQLEYSPDSQLKLIREYAKRNAYVVPEEYVYIDEGVTGRNAIKREAFQRMIRDARLKPAPFEVILLWKFSRFARNQEEAITYKSLLQKQSGIHVISISEPMVEGPFGTLLERIIEWFDEYYSINLAQEVKRGMIEKVSRGEPVCYPAFGYDMVNGRYVPNEDAEVVKRIFSAYAGGAGCRAIAADCAASGVRTGRGNPPDSRFIEYILRNPVYVGKIRWSPEGHAASRREYSDSSILTVRGQHAPIVKQALFDRVQEMLEDTKKRYARYQRRNAAPASFMLKGLVRCSNCGSTLVRRSSNIPSLQCHAYGKGICGVSHSLSLQKASRTVIMALQSALPDCHFSFSPLSDSSIKSDYSKLLEAEEKKLKRIQTAYIHGLDTLKEYESNKRSVLTRMQKIREEAERQASEQGIDIQAYANRGRHLLDILQCATISESVKNEALRAILSNIVYDKVQKRLLFYFYIAL